MGDTMARSTTDPALRHPQLTSIEGGARRAAAGHGGVDEDLVDRARRNDLDAWARLYQEHYDAVFGHVCFLCGDSTLAEDLVQDVFALAMTRVDQYDGRAPLLSWLRAIALNRVRMHWRSASSSARVRQDLEAIETQLGRGAANDVDRIRTRDVRAQILYAVLQTLPSRLAEAFVLREMEGLSTQEAADELGISPGNVAVRASRARDRIRKELRRRGWLEEGTS
jgi:RNA polymerase sigma-70 factor (ECF subfamily)